ncbi:MAG: hypothetical protein IOD09_11870 [Rhodocyclaceae bacterium]|nr:hypothetical protein [Rhodocyclaceae bacterium]
MLVISANNPALKTSTLPLPTLRSASLLYQVPGLQTGVEISSCIAGKIAAICSQAENTSEHVRVRLQVTRP